MVDRTLLPSGEVPWHLPLPDRLQAVGLALLSQALSFEVIALMRVVVTTAHRMPELAKLADRIGWDSGVYCIATAIAGENATAEAIERASTVASTFIDLVFVPHQMRALLGDDSTRLEAEAPRRVSEAIDLLSKAGWLTE